MDDEGSVAAVCWVSLDANCELSPSDTGSEPPATVRLSSIVHRPREARRCLGLAPKPRPFVAVYGVAELVAELAFEEYVPGYADACHANLLHQAGGSGVARIAHGIDARHAERGESVIEERRDSLRAIPLAPVLARQSVAYLALPRVRQIHT